MAATTSEQQPAKVSRFPFTGTEYASTPSTRAWVLFSLLTSATSAHESVQAKQTHCGLKLRLV
jgi:hypothetical protein